MNPQLELDFEMLLVAPLGLDVNTEFDLRPLVRPAGAPGFSNERSLMYWPTIWRLGERALPGGPGCAVPPLLMSVSSNEGPRATMGDGILTRRWCEIRAVALFLAARWTLGGAWR